MGCGWGKGRAQVSKWKPPGVQSSGIALLYSVLQLAQINWKIKLEKPSMQKCDLLGGSQLWSFGGGGKQLVGDSPRECLAASSSYICWTSSHCATALAPGLIADSTMSDSKSTVLQQMYPDFVQVWGKNMKLWTLHLSFRNWPFWSLMHEFWMDFTWLHLFFFCEDKVQNKLTHAPAAFLGSQSPVAMFRKIQDCIYGGPQQSLEERQKCSVTLDARMLLVAFLTFMTYVMYHAQRISFSGIASSMTDEAGFTATKLGMMSTGYMFAYAVGQFVCGRFADTVRPKRALIFGMLCCAFLPILEGIMAAGGCGGQGFCYGLWVLARSLEGLVQATGWTATVAIMGNWFPQEGRGLIMGLWATNSNVGDIFGLHVTSFLLDEVEWYQILWVLAGETHGWFGCEREQLCHPLFDGSFQPNRSALIQWFTMDCFSSQKVMKLWLSCFQRLHDFVDSGEHDLLAGCTSSIFADLAIPGSRTKPETVSGWPWTLWQICQLLRDLASARADAICLQLLWRHKHPTFWLFVR